MRVRVARVWRRTSGRGRWRPAATADDVIASPSRNSVRNVASVPDVPMRLAISMVPPSAQPTCDHLVIDAREDALDLVLGEGLDRVLRVHDDREGLLRDRREGQARRVAAWRLVARRGADVEDAGVGVADAGAGAAALDAADGDVRVRLLELVASFCASSCRPVEPPTLSCPALAAGADDRERGRGRERRELDLPHVDDPPRWFVGSYGRSALLRATGRAACRPTRRRSACRRRRWPATRRGSPACGRWGRRKPRTRPRRSSRTLTTSGSSWVTTSPSGPGRGTACREAPSGCRSCPRTRAARCRRPAMPASVTARPVRQDVREVDRDAAELAPAAAAVAVPPKAPVIGLARRQPVVHGPGRQLARRR